MAPFLIIATYSTWAIALQTASMLPLVRPAAPDASRADDIDRKFILQARHLLLVEPGEREHAILFGHEAEILATPCSLSLATKASRICQIRSRMVCTSASHSLLSAASLSTVVTTAPWCWRVGVVGPDSRLHLAECHVGHLRRGGHQGDGPHPLIVQAKVSGQLMVDSSR